MKGHYRVKSFALRQLHERARKLAAALDYFVIEHVPREENREADRLANEALERTDEKQAVSAGAHGEARKAKLETRPAEKRIRARYRHGALYPAEPLDLAEGAEVEITVHKPHRE